MKGQEVIDFGWDNIVKEFGDDDKSGFGGTETYVDVGVVASDGASKAEDSGLTLVELAIIQEFGTENIPKRPFIRQTFDKNLRDLDKLVQQLDEEIMEGKTTRKKALKLIGQTHQNQIQKAMSTRGEFEANAESTIQQKGSDMPLINTGGLRQAINFEVG